MIRIDWNRENVTYLVLRIILIVATIFCYKIVINLDDTLSGFYKIFDILSPFLLGFLLAFLLNPGVSRIEFYLRKLYKDPKTLESAKKQGRYIRRLSIFIMYFIVLLFISITLRYVIPSLSDSIQNLIESSKNGDITEYFTLYIDRISAFASDFLDMETVNKNLENLVPTLKDLQSFLKTAFPQVLQTSINITSTIFDVVMSLIISIYFIADKERFIVIGRKITLAFLKPSRADWLIDIGAEANVIFKRFFIGKTLDSLIIGIICFLLMSAFQFDYPLLISVIIGVTNMIPYFGPIIGAIPGFFIILFTNAATDPGKALWFALFVLALQQFDGIILGPKILGDSVGLRPIWIIFSILVGGALFGFVGMLLGVPTFTLIYVLTKRFINRRLQEKHVPEQLYALPEPVIPEVEDEETKK